MKSIFCFFLKLCILGSVVAQYSPASPYQKIKFESLTPLYHTTLYDANFRDQGSDGYNCFQDLNIIEPLIHNNHLFTIYFNYLSSPGIFGSYYITCIDMNDGKVVWMNKLIPDNISNIEIPRLMEINENNELLLSGHKKKTIYEGQNFMSDGLIFQRKYDISTGNLIDLYHRDYNDTLAYDTEYILFFKSLFFKDQDNNLRIVERINSSEIVGFKSYLLDNTGMLIEKPDTILYSYFDDFVNNVNIAVIGEDSLVMVEIGLDDTNAFIILRYLTYDLKVISEVKITSPVEDNLPFIRIEGVSQIQNLILLNVWQYDSTSQREYNLKLVLNKSGKILKNILVPLDNEVLKWTDNTDNILIYRPSLNFDNSPTSSNLIQFLTCKDEFECDILNNHKVEDPLRFAYIIKYFEYNDKEILILDERSLRMQSSYNVVDDYAYAKSILAFKKGEFLPESLLTNMKDTYKETMIPTIKSYPNPSSGPLILDIKGITGKADVRIFDILGRNVYLQDGITDGETTMDLSGLAAGTYIFKIYQGSKEIGCGQWVKQ